MIENELWCDNCSHVENCKHDYGEKRDDGDDYRAVVGTHFCRKSWDTFDQHCREKVCHQK